jgi:hypothetical protein
MPRPTLRIITIINFIPAFALCIAYAARRMYGQKAVPTVGLLPMAVSAGLGFLALRHERWRARKHAGAGTEAERGDANVRAESGGGGGVLAFRVMVFVADVVVAVALMVVLVFTWIDVPRAWYPPSPSDVMLAAYATVPLLVNL